MNILTLRACNEYQASLDLPHSTLRCLERRNMQEAVLAMNCTMHMLFIYKDYSANTLMITNENTVNPRW